MKPRRDLPLPHKSTGLRAWALAQHDRSIHSKGRCALANKLARIAYACLGDRMPYDGDNPSYSVMRADRSDWRAADAAFHVGTGTHTTAHL